MQAGPSPAGASTLPSGFRDSVVLSGLTNPTVMQFAPDGRIFVGQKNGVIKVFQSLTDTKPVTFADLSGEVDDYWDRGLLGLALPPNFPANPYVYVLYTYDAPIGGTEISDTVYRLTRILTVVPCSTTSPAAGTC